MRQHLLLHADKLLTLYSSSSYVYRYLSLTTNANLPPSINKLWFLEYLIIRQHWIIINHHSRACVADESYVPVEIWELQQLKHLQIMGRNLPHPPTSITILPNLKELLDVGVQTCTGEVFKSIPELRKLRIRIELAPDVDAAQTIGTCFDHVSGLHILKSFQGVIRNPKLFPSPAVPPHLLSLSRASIRKLSLSGFRYPWENMRAIAKTPCLQVLKLQSYAFRGEKWKADEMRFEYLSCLLIEDTDLAHWTAAQDTFKTLSYLTLRNCHKLREIPHFTHLQKIQLHDCNPLAETCAKQNHTCNMEVDYSWKK